MRLRPLLGTWVPRQGSREQVLMRERKTPSTFPQSTHGVPHPEAQCLPRRAGGEVGVVSAGQHACVGTSSCAAWQRRGGRVWPGQAASQVTSLADRPSCRLQLWPLPHVGEDQAVPGPTSKRLPPEHPCARDRASAHARELHRASQRPAHTGGFVLCSPDGARWGHRSRRSQSLGPASDLAMPLAPAP